MMSPPCSSLESIIIKSQLNAIFRLYCIGVSLCSAVNEQRDHSGQASLTSRWYRRPLKLRSPAAAAKRWQMKLR